MAQTHALVIDDNTQNLRVLATLLQKQQVTCTEVADPTTLEATLDGLDHVDVAFVDLEMPGLNGFAVKDMLRERLGEIPIVAYTVHLSEMHTVRDRGFSGFLGKPLQNDRFPQQLARILRGEHVWERS